MKTPRIALLLLFGSGLLVTAAEFKLPLEIRQNLTTDNLQSPRGVPLSPTNGVPPASDGRAPTQATQIAEGLTINPPTASQFQGLLSYGGIPGLSRTAWQTVKNDAGLQAGTNAFSGALAERMQLPVAKSSGVVVMIFRRAQIGAPYQNRQISFLFGSVIPVPEKDEIDQLLPTNVVKESYWLAEPYSVNNHADAPYYWSSNALQVFAIQAGPLAVTWKKAAPYTVATKPSGYVNENGSPDIPSFETNGASVFLLHTVRYVVSGSAIKPPRKMYWTQRDFLALGKPVAVPKARVGGVQIVYNQNFPKTVAKEFVGPGSTSPTDGSTNTTLPELRTLWYDQPQGNIYAFNQEGRVFLELLGDARPDNSHQHLGFEIVDVSKQPFPEDVTIELGEPITPPAGSPAALVPAPVQQPGQGETFAYQQNVAGSEDIELYATGETHNLNDYQVHWLEAGSQGIKWPARFGRYQFIWPADTAKYSHYARPPAATDEEAKQTAVPLANANVPTIAYQDADAAGGLRANLTADFKFYTRLDAGFPAHRTLLRFTAGAFVTFERVFSWLDTNLKATDFTGTLATNLTAVTDYFGKQKDYQRAKTEFDANLPADQAAYDAYLTARTRGVNGLWSLVVSNAAGGGEGSIASWAVVVETTNAATGLLATNEFTFAETEIVIPSSAAGPTNATPYGASIFVDGITNTVTAVRVKLNRFTHTVPKDVDVFLVGPEGKVCVLMSDAGGVGPGVQVVNLVFDDAASQQIPAVAPTTDTHYKPFDYAPTESLVFPGNVNAATLVTTLAGLLGPMPATEVPEPTAPPKPILWANAFTAPRVITDTVEVGQRLHAPAGELGTTTNGYLAGHLNTNMGDLYSPGAYVDPYVSGFAAANLGAIIPVNAIPGTNFLEVTWFRTNAPSAGYNAANGAQGFEPIYWPSVIGRYTIQWPANPAEIVLASNDGSGSLPSEQATGGIYVQNDPSLPGYNPNEEHALMQGGQAFALRDDLNLTKPDDPAELTGPDATYSSEPFVLLQYAANDGRPAMKPFKVLREKGDVKFNYRVNAGTVLQAPMPLPLLEQPTVPKLTENGKIVLPRSLNSEVEFRTVGSSTTNGVLTTVEPNHFRPWFRELALQPTDFKTTNWFIVTNADYAAKSLSGVVAVEPAISIGSGVATTRTNVEFVSETGFLPRTRRERVTIQRVLDYQTAAPQILNYTQAVYVVAPALGSIWNLYVDDWSTSKRRLVVTSSSKVVSHSEFFAGPPIGGGTSLDPLTTSSPEVLAVARELYDQLPVGDSIAKATLLFVPVASLAVNQFKDWQLRTEPVPASGKESDASFTLQDRKGNLWVYRGPHEEQDDPYMTTQFYYKTLPGFFFPGVANQPPEGTITPYLRSADANGGFVGDAVAGYKNNLKDQDGKRIADGNALAITYRPVWPADVPVLQMAETLTLPKRGLPSVRGQTSLQVVYQQSQKDDPNHITIVLHDPTREKEYRLGPADGTAELGKLPDSIKTSLYQGKTYFPNLPPHLSERLFYDPNRGENGALVFKGQFFDEPVGDDYVLLNVIGQQDATELKQLCLVGDPLKAKWDGIIANGLQTLVERFVENPQKPGTYVAAEGARSIGPGELADVRDDDEAVDSYALTATGPGTGYVTLMAGNGLAFFTPQEEPVSLQVIKVVDTLYRGEVKIVKSSNPLSEKLTLQQVVDLAGQVQDYEFEWLITSPVDGSPPPVYLNTPTTLLGDGPWSHIPFPLPTDTPATAPDAVAPRVLKDVGTAGIFISKIAFDWAGNYLDPSLGPAFLFENYPPHNILNAASLGLTKGNELTALMKNGQEVGVTMEFIFTGTLLTIIDGDPETPPKSSEISELYERALPNQAQSIVFRDVTVAATKNLTQYWLSLELDSALGARVYVDGALAVTANTGNGDSATLKAPPGFAALSRAYKLGPEVFAGGTRANGNVTHHLVVELFSQALPGVSQKFNLRLEAYESVDQTGLAGSVWLPLDQARHLDKIRAIIGGAADVRALSDNYLISRYRATNANHVSFSRGWSQWTEPQLAEGWIKRVLAGINPFNQRVTDLFNNSVNTDVSILTQAGHRWEGDVALNLASINNYGLIEIYETVLRRGRMLSIDGGINYGPANDALLLVAGYLNDLYLMEGNEAWADAANPTIGIGTKDSTYGDVATALFAFKGQVPSLLEEELALLRGRDDLLQPGVETAPVYNRMFWNYTRGIDAGEVIYALNYNIQENPNATTDGVINAADAARMFPQGHGDAYGHYLTALKGYYSLLVNSKFDWVPRIEAVTVLGKPVAVDYQDERKFAAAAAAVARAGRQVFDLTWRKDYQPVSTAGWEHFGTNRVNTVRSSGPSTRYWGLDHQATRTGQGAYLNWVAGNAILPAVDPDPNHEGIQKVDRTTVPELKDLAALADGLQTALANAEGGLSPLGLPQDALAFDINPNAVVGTDNGTHFEQVYQRTKVALNNAVASFDDAKDVTRLMRSEQDSLNDLQATVSAQELAYTNTLIELYGTPYPDDIGPGKLYKQGYAGPDIVHYMYAELPEYTFPELWSYTESNKWETYYLRDVDPSWRSSVNTYIDFSTNKTIEFNIGPHGFADKPPTWTSRRASPGRIQQAISEKIAAHAKLRQAVNDAVGAQNDLTKAIAIFEANARTYSEIRDKQRGLLIADEVLQDAQFALNLYQKYQDSIIQNIVKTGEATAEALPKATIVGVASGGDLTFAGRAAILAAGNVLKQGLETASLVRYSIVNALDLAIATTKRWSEFSYIQPRERDQELRQLVSELGNQLGESQGHLWTINQRLREREDAERNYRALLAEGDRIQQEREIFRQRSAAVIQGFRTRDAAFRIFRNEKLERYKTLFDLAARYALLAANAYDYETGLLNTSAGRAFVSRIINSRALGVVRNGEPQFAGSNTGDPGLSSALAEMKADWDVLRGRLGFNNPDAYGTTVSLRMEDLRILPGSAGDTNWKDTLQRARVGNVLDDADVRRYCMQITSGDGLPVPGLIVSFSTTIADGHNLFGQRLAAGDHNFSPSSFATKIFGVGVAFEGYRGMDNPAANSGAVSGGGSPGDPGAWYLDPQALAATPYVYLIPVGVDSMRSPPLGDVSTIRSWTVNDVAIPMPFNIGASDFSTKQLWQSAESLTEPLFAIRKHQAFRPVSNTGVFSPGLYGVNGTLVRSQFTNNRLVGRSVWNSRWKLVIPGKNLLDDPNEGLERFIATVKDIKLHLVTYSYAGN